MRIAYVTSNENTHSLATWMAQLGDEVILYTKKLTSEWLHNNHIDFVVSYNYKYIIREDVIAVLPDRIINLHISLLPWNRGADPNIWSFIESTPKGVTIHNVDVGVDTGDVLVQKEIYLNGKEETLRSSYDKLHLEIFNLFKDNWESIKFCKIEKQPQPAGGSIHYKAELDLYRHSIDYDKCIPDVLSDLYSMMHRNKIIRRYMMIS